MLAVMQRTISKLCRGFEFTAAGESVPKLVYADDGQFLSNDIATMQLALECAWLVTKICGNSLQVKQKKNRPGLLRTGRTTKSGMSRATK